MMYYSISIFVQADLQVHILIIDVTNEFTKYYYDIEIEQFIEVTT